MLLPPGALMVKVFSPKRPPCPEKEVKATAYTFSFIAVYAFHIVTKIVQ
jgi:hypothetical protein